jgi:hypothetical protein
MIKAGYQCCRIIDNDGTYYISIPELTIDGAVLPKTPRGVVETLQPRLWTHQHQVLHYQLDSAPTYVSTLKYLTRAVGKWEETLRGLNLEHEIPPFLDDIIGGEADY